MGLTQSIEGFKRKRLRYLRKFCLHSDFSLESDFCYQPAYTADFEFSPHLHCIKQFAFFTRTAWDSFFILTVFFLWCSLTNTVGVGSKNTMSNKKEKLPFLWDFLAGWGWVHNHVMSLDPGGTEAGKNSPCLQWVVGSEVSPPRGSDLQQRPEEVKAKGGQ